MLEAAIRIVGNLNCVFMLRSHEIDFDSNESAKGTIVEILQTQLNKFNELGKRKP
jgi:hypothetical protein